MGDRSDQLIEPETNFQGNILECIVDSEHDEKGIEPLKISQITGYLTHKYNLE